MTKARKLAVIALVFAASPAVQAQQPADNETQAARDQLRAAVQKICPVSGHELGQHGAPVKVQIGKEELFLCCDECLQGNIDPRHWATIHANFARAQRICPVMKHKLPKKPKWTIVEGRIVYVCCPPCIKKIAADPQTYLKKVDLLYTASLETRGPSRR